MASMFVLYLDKNDLSVSFDDKSCFPFYIYFFTVSTGSFLRLRAYRFTPWSIEKYLNINTNNGLLCKSVVYVLFCTFSLHYYILQYNLKEEDVRLVNLCFSDIQMHIPHDQILQIS